MNDIESALNQLQDMLSSESGRAELTNMVGAVSRESEDVKENVSPLPISGGAMDSLFKIRSLLDSINAVDDPRIRLLSALRPYLSSSRSAHIDNAIKIMSLGKIPSVLKNMRG